MDDYAEDNLCDYCEEAKVAVVCSECFQGMWCSEKCHQLDAADHEEYDCYHPDDLSDECVLEEVNYETHDPTEARQIMKEMIGDDLMMIGDAASRARRRQRRRLRRMARKKRRRLRRQRLKANRERRKEKRDLRREERERKRYYRELRRGEKEEEKLEKAKAARDAAKDASRTYAYGVDDLPDVDTAPAAAHIASFFV